MNTVCIVDEGMIYIQSRNLQSGVIDSAMYILQDDFTPCLEVKSNFKE